MERGRLRDGIRSVDFLETPDAGGLRKKARPTSGPAMLAAGMEKRGALMRFWAGGRGSAQEGAGAGGGSGRSAREQAEARWRAAAELGRNREGK
jgi:hypothetical protein